MLSPLQPTGAGSQDIENRLPSFINSLGDGFLAIRADGIIELSNSMSHNLLDANLLKGQPVNKVVRLVDDSGAPLDLLALASSSSTGFSSRDYRLKIGADDIINVFINVSPLQSAFGKNQAGGWAILIRDITREKNLEKERDEFISVASHELRTPVAIAEGSISNAILMAERGRLPDPFSHVLKSGHEQLVFLGSLINDLAMLSRADRGRIATAFEEVDLKEIILQLERDYQTAAGKKNLILRSEEVNDLPKVYSSKLYIYEILQNFVSNGLKYTEKGMVSIVPKATDNGVSIIVKDSGIGIEKADQQKLFTKFFRSEDFRVRQASGTGLGLYISAKLASLIGAGIKVDTELNKGSTFTLLLPSSVYHDPAQVSPKTVA